jgi:tight adherence protein C
MAIELILAIVGVFAAVLVGVGSLMYYVLAQTAPERRRLERAGLVATSGVLIDANAGSLTPDETDFAKKVSSVIPRSPKDMTRLRRQFVRAGYQSLTPVAIYSIAQIACPVVFAALPLFFGGLSTVWIFCIITGLMGWLVPGVVLGRMIKARQKIIQNGLPDALDLMIVCLEAGSSIDQAILKVADELSLAYPALAEEFQVLLTETRAGKPRLEAFRNLAERTGVDDVRSLVAMLVQTDRFGTSVSMALRTHAEVSRTKRRQRAEERAAKIGVKLVFPLVFCLFPAMFVVTLGPAVIRFIRVLFGDVMGNQ